MRFQDFLEQFFLVPDQPLLEVITVTFALRVFECVSQLRVAEFALFGERAPSGFQEVGAGLFILLLPGWVLELAFCPVPAASRCHPLLALFAMTLAHLFWASTHGLVSLELAGKLCHGRSLDQLAAFPITWPIPIPGKRLES